MPDPIHLTRKHLETFAWDPHAASFDEVQAMAKELLAARARITELESVRDTLTATVQQERQANALLLEQQRQTVDQLEAVRAALAVRERPTIDDPRNPNREAQR